MFPIWNDLEIQPENVWPMDGDCKVSIPAGNYYLGDPYRFLSHERSVLLEESRCNSPTGGHNHFALESDRVGFACVWTTALMECVYETNFGELGILDGIIGILDVRWFTADGLAYPKQYPFIAKFFSLPEPSILCITEDGEAQSTFLDLRIPGGRYDQ